MSEAGNFPSNEKAPEVNSDEERSKKKYMKLLHDYNEIKDATQVILGVVANIEGVTIKRVHEKFGLPTKDELV